LGKAGVCGGWHPFPKGGGIEEYTCRKTRAFIPSECVLQEGRGTTSLRIVSMSIGCFGLSDLQVLPDAAPNRHFVDFTVGNGHAFPRPRFASNHPTRAILSRKALYTTTDRRSVWDRGLLEIPDVQHERKKLQGGW